MTAIAGVAYIKVDGNQLSLRGDLTISPFLVEREGIAGADGVHGYKETFRVPHIEMTVTDRGDLSLEEIQNITNATITAELINGKNYLLRNAWCATALELDAIEGQLTVRFEGMSGEEVLDNAIPA
jgi:hypothetical protein